MAAADDDLVQRAKSGDPEAWRLMYSHVGGKLVLWLRSQPQLDVALDADDIAHDAWVVAAGKIADFGGSVDDFTGWLFGIARNLMTNVNRRTLRRATSSIDDHAPLRDPQTPDEAQAAAHLDWTRRLLSRLPAREAQVVACIDVVGLDVATTSTTLDISATAVRVAHHRGLRRLRTIMAKEPDGVSGTSAAATDALDHLAAHRVGSRR